MRIIGTVIFACLFSTTLLFASEVQMNAGRSPSIDLLLERAISRNLIAGGVVVVGNHDGIISTTSRGRLNSSDNSPFLNQETIFDLASLTKVIATTPAIMKLLDQGRISLSDPLTRWFPEFRGSCRENVSILNLLTHTSGLTDISFHSSESVEGAFRRVAAQRYNHPAGSRFNYADINFILLGELVHRVTGQTLDTFCREQIYQPMGARETMFLPPKSIDDLIAPTTGYVSGVVQDCNARRLGGVAGHAGLFSSASDLALFARLVLGHGTIDGRRILSPEIVAQMTSPYFSDNGAVMRGLGWDMESPFSAPKGRFFSEASFGHTGYSGSSIWIDPQQDLFVVLLTNRVNYRNPSIFNQLRRDVSTVASVSFRKGYENQDLSNRWDLARLTAELLEASPPVVKVAERVQPSLGKYAKLQRQHRGQQRTALVAHKKMGSHRIARTANYTKKKRVTNKRA